MQMSHKNKEEVTTFVEYMKGINGESIPVVRGKKHTYVRMELDYSSSGEVIVSTESSIAETIEEFLEEMAKAIKTPAGNHPLKVNNTCVKLCEIFKIIFYRLVAKLLFLSKRARPDIHPTIAFLATRVKNIDEEDWKKL